MDTLTDTNRQVSKLCEVFMENLSANIKLSRTSLSKIVQKGGFLSKLLGSSMKCSLLLMKMYLSR